ncbi:NB-ARC domain-containing protein [Acrocarpospora sp. B8E8]|uniref:NB-ARC domain-containing protein n=1 Tax=Acrocarpospora sp. B8E8 TaxID=3153572 RepID=UPI00325C4B36
MITGMAGAGKTELAIRIARQLASRYPDGLFWLGLRTYAAAESRMGTAEALRTLLNTLGVAPDPQATDVAGLSQKWRSVTADRRLLLILDDVDHADQVRPLLPAAEGCAVLVTSRHALIGLDPDRAVALDPLSEDEARFLADAILQRAGHRDPFTAAAIAAVYRLPLAVRQITDLKAANPSLDIAELSTTVNGGGKDEAAAALALSVGALTPDARLLLRRIAHYPRR